MIKTYSTRPFDGEGLLGQHFSLRQRLAQLAMRFLESITPDDLGDVDDEATA